MSPATPTPSARAEAGRGTTNEAIHEEPGGGGRGGRYDLQAPTPAAAGTSHLTLRIGPRSQLLAGACQAPHRPVNFVLSRMHMNPQLPRRASGPETTRISGGGGSDSDADARRRRRRCPLSKFLSMTSVFEPSEEVSCHGLVPRGFLGPCLRGLLERTLRAIVMA